MKANGSGITKPLHPNGRPVDPYDFDEDAESILAVLPDDKIVHICGWQRTRVGGGILSAETGTASEQWFWEDEKQGPPGLYALIAGLPKTIETEKQRRISTGKAWKRWLETADCLGIQMVDDPELLAEVMEVGLGRWLEGH